MKIAITLICLMISAFASANDRFDESWTYNPLAIDDVYADNAENNQSIIVAVTKAESPVWQGFQEWRGKTKSNGKSGSKRRYYEWDNTHEDIEVYDSNGNHLGSMDPMTGAMIKPPVPGRKINL